MKNYKLLGKKGEGTFSEVLKVQHRSEKTFHAMKCLKGKFTSRAQVENLREVQALRRLSPHEHIVELHEIVFDEATGRLALVFELMDANLYDLIRGRRVCLSPSLVRSYIHQLLQALAHVHDRSIFHRDIKPENVLVDQKTGRVKLADFGSCRGIYSARPFTQYISTRWYRPPECLLSDGCYGAPMDMWGTGCVLFEIASLQPLFPGDDEIDQLSRIHKVLGTPPAHVLERFHRYCGEQDEEEGGEEEEVQENGNEQAKDKRKTRSRSSLAFAPLHNKGTGLDALLPPTHASVECLDLLRRLLAYEAAHRLGARDALRHPYFRGLTLTTTDTTTVEAGAKTTGSNAAAVAATGGGGGFGIAAATGAGEALVLHDRGHTEDKADKGTHTHHQHHHQHHHHHHHGVAIKQQQQQLLLPEEPPSPTTTTSSSSLSPSPSSSKRKKMKKACGGAVVVAPAGGTGAGGGIYKEKKRQMYARQQRHQGGGGGGSKKPMMLEAEKGGGGGRGGRKMQA